MPSQGDLDTMTVDGTAYVFFQYAGVPDTVTFPLYTCWGMSDEEHYSTLGALTSEEVEQSLRDFAASGISIPIIVRAKLRTAFMIMRRAAGHDTAPSVPNTISLHHFNSAGDSC